MSNTPPDFPAAFQTITIVGVGLIGGSIAAGIKQRRLSARIIGVGRSQSRLEQARRAGLIDAATEDLPAAAAESDLIVVCTPVDRIAVDVNRAAAHCRPGTLLTDGGSVKAAICNAIRDDLPQGVHFVGAHPLAGSEKQGFQFADADLFEGRICVVTPHTECNSQAAARVSDFWRELGATVVEMSPQEHDDILAETSHLPHLIASTLVGILQKKNRPFSATGFRDTTRIAAGDEHLWAAIFQSNATALLAGLDRFEDHLGEMRSAIKSGDEAKLVKLLAAARQVREGL